jgi:hypothetical protein
VFGKTFVVLGEPAAPADPGQGAFDDPPAWEDLEGALSFGFLHDLHGDA